MAYLQFYQGYYAGGSPTVLSANPFDVAQDLSTGNLWQYNGAAWVAPSWNSAITFYLGGAQTVCERINSENTKYPDTIQLYPGDSELVPAEIRLSPNDLAVKHDLGNYSVQVGVFRRDVVSDTVVAVPFPAGEIISTEDGNWTLLKNLTQYVGFDYCTVALTWTSVGGEIGPQVLDFVTSAQVSSMISSAITAAAQVEIVSGGSIGYIPTLAGGRCYRFKDPLTVLSIGVIRSSLEETDILFTADATVSPPVSVTVSYQTGNEYGYNEETDEEFSTPTYTNFALVSSGNDYAPCAIGSRTWYDFTNDLDDHDGNGYNTYYSVLSNGSFTCTSASDKWVISAVGISQYVSNTLWEWDDEANEDNGDWIEITDEETSVLNTWVASSTDMVTWTVNNGATLNVAWLSPDLGEEAHFDETASITASATVTPCDVVLPSGAILVNSNTISISSGGRYEMNIKYGAIVTGEWMEGSHE